MFLLKHIKDKIQSSVKFKMQFLIILTLLSSLLIITITFNTIYSKTLIQQKSQSSIHKLQLLTNNMDLLKNSIENYSRMIITSDQMQNILSNNDAPNSLNHLNHINNLKGSFSNLIARDNIINSIFIMDLRYDYIYDIGGDTWGLTNSNFIPTTIEDDLLRKKKHYIWTDLYKSPYKISNEYQEIFTCYESIMNMNTGEIGGIIAVNLNAAALSDMLSDVNLGNSSTFSIINVEGNILLSTNRSFSKTKELYTSFITEWNDNKKATGVIRYDHEKYLVFTQPVYDNWDIIGYVPLKEIMPPSFLINTTILALALLVFIITTALSLLFSRQILKPILQVTQLMKDTTSLEDLNIRIDTSLYKDESGLLLQSYNNMMSQISDLIKQIQEEQQQKRRFQISLIHSQVKPHFLYNSLNSISGLIYTKHSNEALQMIHGLGEFYHLSLKHDDDFVSVHKELQLIDSYITIQSQYWKGQLEYFKHFDDGSLKCIIPKFLLQPLVENAFKHGFRNLKHHKPILSISGEIISHQLILTVMDNGNGSKMDNLQKLVCNDNPDHFGLFNINNMLSLHYKDNYALEFHTEEQQGFRVKIIIPAQEGR